VQNQQNRIGELRRAKGLSLAALAKQANTTAATIDRLEKGKIKLSVDWLSRLAGPLGVRPGDLVHWSEAQLPEPSGEFRWDGNELRIEVNSLRHAIHSACWVLSHAMTKAPDVPLTGMAETISILTMHFLKGFGVYERLIDHAIAFLWIASGQEEKAKEAERWLEEEKKRLKGEMTETERRVEEFESLASGLEASIRTPEREVSRY